MFASLMLVPLSVLEELKQTDTDRIALYSINQRCQTRELMVATFDVDNRTRDRSVLRFGNHQISSQWSL